ncbi:ATP-binding protein [Methylophaga sp. OBS1]|uniref:ATP-binding protein n=1 Tax=Methylophaga sp. OBS1 TaxID=2991933 RepID=UPI00224CAA88|nr:ATP-binding protein [Methylophaga sp. OBS1]MCX4191013.1 ATP-binding protein [Methylophaga sp. OBS1]MCX4192041.1 ATP-binding protein [Methylophaga sp. OBS1]
MSEHIDLSPNPIAHIRTLSSIGYNLNSAIADIIDNSITAQAKNIWVDAEIRGNSVKLRITDDGFGMSRDELIENMRISCRDPFEERHENDLGRFGSGMKTASFSQAKILTVISKTSGSSPAVAIWDLNFVEEKNAWLIRLPQVEQFNLLYQEEINSLSSGTTLIWEQIYRYSDLNEGEIETTVSADIAALKKFLSLYFHKFLQSGLRIFINRQAITPIDPFLTKSKGYQEGPSQSFRVKKGGKVEIRVHTLPHESKLTKKELDDLGGPGELTANQGLYVYRSNRLIIAGGWHGLTQWTQLGKLARVEVNVPASLDSEWGTDVKKATLEIPTKIRTKLKQLIQDPIKRSKRSYRYRGQVEEANSFWDIRENDREATVTYELSRDNNRLKDILEHVDKETADKLVAYLIDVSSTLPINHIYEKMSSKPNSIDQTKIEFSDLLKEVEHLWKKQD